jgi:hypothetical protein
MASEAKVSESEGRSACPALKSREGLIIDTLLHLTSQQDHILSTLHQTLEHSREHSQRNAEISARIAEHESKQEMATRNIHSLYDERIALLEDLRNTTTAYLEDKLETTTAHLEGKLELTTKHHQEEHDLTTKHHQEKHNLTIKLREREHELHVDELKTAHATTTTKLNGEIAALREELASLRAQHTGRENGAERESAEVPKELSEEQK